MWNLPPRQPLLVSDPTAFSLAEDLRARAYELQVFGGRLDDVLLRLAGASYLDAHALRIVLDELARCTSLEWGRAWIPLTSPRLAVLCRCPERMMRRSMERLVGRGLIDRRRRGTAGGGVVVEVSCDPRQLSELLDLSTWCYLLECFPDEPRPALNPDILAAVLASPKSDMVSLFRTVTHVRSSKTGADDEKSAEENTL